MSELVAPPGAFGLVEFERGATPRELEFLFHVIPRLPQVQSLSDLSTVPLVLLEERVLLRLSPAELQQWLKATRPPRKERGHGHQGGNRQSAQAVDGVSAAEPQAESAGGARHGIRVRNLPLL